jgi:glycosyltransferase involved in cell wall biosynthesis
VLNAFPETELTIAGRVCEKIGNYAHCTKVGQVENLAALYTAADVAINPILAGRGLKIKNIEAIGFGTPLVTTAVGAEGLEEGAGKAFLVGDTAAAFAGQVCRLLADFDLYCAVSSNAYAFARQYNQEAYWELNDELERFME